MLLWNATRQSRQFPLDPDHRSWLRYETTGQDVGFVGVVDWRGDTVPCSSAGLKVTDGHVPQPETAYIEDQKCVLFLQTAGRDRREPYRVYVGDILVMELRPRVAVDMALHGPLAAHSED